VAVVAEGDGFAVALDGRPIRTPGKAPLRLPTRAFAEAVAAEWAAQGELIDPRMMPATRLANAAIDKVARQADAVAAHVAAYGASDLLCYRAEGPAELVAREAAEWDPLLAWAAEALGARLAVTRGVMPIAQDPVALARLEALVADLDPFALAAFHDLAALSGSLVLALAVIRGRLDLDEAWRLSRLDEDFQAEEWGADEEAAEAALRRRAAFLDAARLWRLLGGRDDRS